VKEVDNIRDLFNEKLGNFEAPVRPELWTNISSQIGVTSSTTVGGGLSLFAKTIIGISVAASVAVGSYFLVKERSTKKENFDQEHKLVVNTTKDSETTNTDVTSDVNSNKLSPSTPGIKELIDIAAFTPQKDKVSVVTPFGYDEINVDVAPGLNTENSEGNRTEGNKDETTNTEANNITNTSEEDNIATEESSNSNDIAASEVEIKELPDIFTPNGDRINDFLSVESNGLTDFNVVVLDQNSKIVYQSSQADFVWDGTALNGEIVPEGNYVYYITARNSEGKMISKHSMLRIER